MDHERDPIEKLEKRLLELKSDFSNHNIVRMREALRYLSGSSLELFIKIPFFIHVNSPEIPGYVKDKDAPWGIYNFEASGFYREVLEKKLMSEDQISKSRPASPCVMGLYHIGSLGTFTQSAASDFDYWVIIDKTQFSELRYYNLEKKLNKIVKFSREVHRQKVSFFIMDRSDIKNDIYAGYDEVETMTAPKVFLKEEFYRTFLMIAGKIPLWALVPPGSSSRTCQSLKKAMASLPALKSLSKGVIDLGVPAPPKDLDILKGILWHICKSRSDPVKAMIKAAMIFSYGPGTPEEEVLLCDKIKAGYAGAGIDDYRADPYRLVFDRIIHHHRQTDPKGLNLIKNAIFFRLCGYPDVKAPEKNSPKRALLDRYIREWNLSQVQVNKLLAFCKWAEPEKQLLEKTVMERLEKMVSHMKKRLDREPREMSLSETEKRNFKILSNKAEARLKQSEKKIPECSFFLRRQIFTLFIIQEKRFCGWHLSGYYFGQPLPGKLHQHDSFLGVWGWILENQLYDRARTSVKIDVSARIFEHHANPVDPDRLYLALQPIKPLSDEAFEEKAFWFKQMVLLIYGDKQEAQILERVEILSLNSWGDLFLEAFNLEPGKTEKERYEAVARGISPYASTGLKRFFFQMGSCHDPEAVYEIKKHTGRFSGADSGGFGRKRPVLDRL